MDPDENLNEQRRLTARMLDGYDNPDDRWIEQENAVRLAELVVALDRWIANGGALPRAWRRLP